jgi:hypothetical protein
MNIKNMNIQYVTSLGALAAALLSPSMANASFLLDTGTPGGSTNDVVSSSTWYAEEFYVAAGVPVSSLSAYLTNGTHGATFTFAVYANSGPGGSFLNNSVSNRNADEVASATGTFTTGGWTSASVSWTPSTSGDYWLAIQQTSSGATNQFNAPTEASTSTGTAPALGYAIYSTSAGSKYQPSAGHPIGLEVSAVPLPASGWLLVFGLGGLGTMVRRNRKAICPPLF